MQDDPTDEGPKINQAPQPDGAGDTAPAAAADDDAEPAQPESPSEQPAEGADQEAVDDSATATTDAEQAAATAEPTEPETPPETPPEAAEPAGAEPSSTADESAMPPAGEFELGPLPDAPGDNVAPQRAEFRPLEEVADEIRTRLARPLARDRMNSALNSMRAAMRSYYGDYIAWDVSEARDTQPQPTPPDLAALAEQNGMKAGEVPLVDILQLQETDPVTDQPLYEISRAYDMNFTPFAQIALDNDLPLYKDESIRGAILDTEFLFWKTGELAEQTPTLEECRAEVIQVLKLREGLKLAEAEARSEAERVRSSGRSLAVTYGNDPNRQVIETGSFSWMTPASVPYLPPQISRVPGIQYPGPDFMREVFKLKAGEIGVATGNAGRTVYLVSVKSEDSDPQKLRADYLRSGVSMEIAQLSQQDNRQLMAQWYQDYEKQMGVKWERDPQPDSRTR